MTIVATGVETPSTIKDALLRLSPAYATTPLRHVPRLAADLRVGTVLLKDESARMLGSFKSLGGTYGGLRALARASGLSLAELLARPRKNLPALICASDGNHGLAVAAAARIAGTSADVFLPRGVSGVRARRIEAQGAKIRWIDGEYDDAVDAAAAEARVGRGILVADTTSDADDPVVADVMAGYSVLAAEIREQVATHDHARPTHLFVQAGVGGLASALANNLADWMAPPAAIIVVEPERVACVAAAAEAGRPVRLAGDLDTTASMLSCGEASAPALRDLRRHNLTCLAVSEAALAAAPARMHDAGGPATTPSGAAGFAGALHAANDDALRAKLSLTETSSILLLATEGPLD